MHLDSLIKYTTLAATTAEEMASSFQVPFLASTATLVLSILNCVKVSHGVPTGTTATMKLTHLRSRLEPTGMNV
jgi:hypothetical protein